MIAGLGRDRSSDLLDSASSDSKVTHEGFVFVNDMRVFNDNIQGSTRRGRGRLDVR